MGKAEIASREKIVSGAADSGESKHGGFRAVSIERRLLPGRSAALLRLLVIGALAASAVLGCGIERWAVKTLADPEGVEVSQHAPIMATIGELTNRPAPTRAQLQAAESTRFPDEQQTYQVSALIVGYKLEADDDFHIVLADPRNPKATMIAEIPAGKCASPAVIGGQLEAIFDALQTNFANQFGKPTAKFKKLNKPACVKARGVGFYDFLHGQTGVAKNGFELHPLLGWETVSCGVAQDEPRGMERAD